MIESGVRVGSSDVPWGWAQPVFFPVSVRKLVVLSFCSFGVYQLYWYYQQWRHIRNATGESFSPALRTTMAVLFSYALFKRILAHPSAPRSTQWVALPICIAWVAFGVMSLLPDPLGLLAFMASIVAVVPVQQAANQANRSLTPHFPPNARLTRWNWVLVVLGGLLFVLVLVASLSPPV